jgi:D-beta-D-heptose 7-phosphate kinase/D-beta-D-heptose 1-phosphate adenosyltransferase
MLRVDREDTTPYPKPVLSKLFGVIADVLPDQDAVIIEDYNKGLFAGGAVERLIELCREHNKPVLLDPAKLYDYSRYRGVDAITPNRSEASNAAAMDIVDERSKRAACDKLCRTLDIGRIVLTLDKEGIALYSQDDGFHQYPARAREVFDVTGAGDMVISALAVIVADGKNYPTAVQIANVAAGIEVGKVGVVPLSREDIIDELRGLSSPFEAKVKSLNEMVMIAKQLRSRGRKVAFTNGCFDIIHDGHVQLLHTARQQGDLLIVGLNSDSSVRRLKGPLRPILNEDMRSRMLGSLADVNYIVVFEEDDPIQLLEALKPDVLVKGGDYTIEQVVGHELVQSYGGQVTTVPLVEGISTSQIIERILETHGNNSEPGKE